MIKSKYIRANHSKRYEQSFFMDSKITSMIKLDGYAVVDLLNKDQIEELKAGFTEIASLLNYDFGDLFWPSGRSNNTTIRNLAKNYIDKVLPFALRKFIKEGEINFIGGTYLIKPPSTKSDLSPHQDSSHVLEEKMFSVYCWAPLQDVDEENGCMYVLPKSHMLNIHQRSLSVPWGLKNHTERLKKQMIPLPLKAGQAVFFDAALIHSSPSNYSNKTRVAVNYYLHPKNQPFCHFHFNENKNKVEVFCVTPEFYYDEDFEKRPSSKYPLIEIQDPSLLSFNTNQIKSIFAYIEGEKIKSAYFSMIDFLNLQ